MRRRIALALSPLILLVGFSTAPVRGDVIPGLFATGVDDSGVALGLGVIDPHYVVLDGTPAGAHAVTLSSPDATYLPNDSSSMWVWENSNGQPTNVTRTFRTTFDLTGFNPLTAQINGTWAVDNLGLDILINGVSTGQTAGGFQSFSAFTISSGFVAGINTLDFVVMDDGAVAAFRVGTFSGQANAVPEPASILMIAGGLGLLVVGRRWVKRQGWY